MKTTAQNKKTTYKPWRKVAWNSINFNWKCLVFAQNVTIQSREWCHCFLGDKWLTVVCRLTTIYNQPRSEYCKCLISKIELQSKTFWLSGNLWNNKPKTSRWFPRLPPFIASGFPSGLRGRGPPALLTRSVTGVHRLLNWAVASKWLCQMLGCWKWVWCPIFSARAADRVHINTCESGKPQHWQSFLSQPCLPFPGAFLHWDHITRCWSELSIAL